MNKKFQRRNRRQWKKLISRVHDSQSFAEFCKYYGRTTWGNDSMEYADLFRSWNLLFRVVHDMDTGEVTVSSIAPLSMWPRK